MCPYLYKIFLSRIATWMLVFRLTMSRVWLVTGRRDYVFKLYVFRAEHGYHSLMKEKTK